MTTRQALLTAIRVVGARAFVVGTRVDSIAARADASAAFTSAKSQVAALGFTLKDNREWNEYVLAPKGAPGQTYHSDDLADIIATAKDMARRLAASRTDADKSGEGGKYNAAAVQKEIEKDKRIKPGEAKLIHGLLKGWRKDGDDVKVDAAFVPWIVVLSKGSERKEIIVRASYKEDAARFAHEKLGDHEAGKWKTVSVEKDRQFRSDADDSYDDKTAVELRRIIRTKEASQANARSADHKRIADDIDLAKKALARVEARIGEKKS